jgi:predicted RNase H-like HicB family nuclease
MAKKASITFEVTEDDGWFIAKWDAPHKTGGITTQGRSLPELFRAIAEAVECHFEDSEPSLTR